MTEATKAFLKGEIHFAAATNQPSFEPDSADETLKQQV